MGKSSASKAGGTVSPGKPPPTRKKSAAPSTGEGDTPGSDNGRGKKLVIVESPAKAKTINRYLGGDYKVMASVGHVRDLPSRNPKGDKSPVPGVDLENNFAPTYEILPGKTRVVSELKRAARTASEVWFATDLDREGEAIAWHIADELGIDPVRARRVMFAAITKDEIRRAFSNPHPIDMERVAAQQARRILDRIVGYQVSPLLWKKVARGLSAGRVQSVAVRLIVEREREIRAFVPDESWAMTARFALSPERAMSLMAGWAALQARRDEKGNPPTLKVQNAWLAENRAVTAELVQVGGENVTLGAGGSANGRPRDLTSEVKRLAALAGLRDVQAKVEEDEKGKGPAKFRRTVSGKTDSSVPYRVDGVETKRTRSKPPPPFITSTLQQTAANRIGFAAQRTMRAAQRLYEGVEVPGEGSVGLITYMRTDSTHLADDALEMARAYIQRTFGDRYLPERANVYSSSNKDAQEAHEAIRPTSLDFPPSRLKSVLQPDQFRVYSLIWDRFVACQMTPAEWDSTSVTIKGGTDPKTPLTFRATGRVLAFDGFLRVAGVPTHSDEQTLPALKESQALAPFSIEPQQKFSAAPPRFTEASLIKTLEAEGIGRPSTYAQIIGVIQDREYVEQVDRRFYATPLGEVVTDKLVEAFPGIMEVGYTRELEAELDHIEDEHKDWLTVLRQFYGPFSRQLERAHDTMKHAKAEKTPAPKEYACAKCGAPTEYRFGKGGRFLSCSRYPKCDYAAPVDREGKPREVETADVACPKCGRPMLKRSGRFGPFLGCSGYGDKENPCDGIVKLDKRSGRPVSPAVRPLQTDLACPKCSSPLYVRGGVRGPWLSCSAFPKCRARGKWQEYPQEVQDKWHQAWEQHEKQNPMIAIRDLKGNPLTDAKGKPLPKREEEPAPLSGNGNGDAAGTVGEVGADEKEYGEVA